MKKKKKVLVIDDLPEVLDYFSQLLTEMEGFTFMGGAPNAWEARRLILKNKPSLILLDEILEGESSHDFLKEIQEEEAIPVILLTGMENPEHAVSEYALGRILKPHWTTELKEISKNLESEFTKLLTKGR